MTAVPESVGLDEQPDEVRPAGLGLKVVHADPVVSLDR